jgi:phage FluMu gp28-like protein
MSISGAILLPYQERWVEDTRPVKIIEKSRRIGLSYSEAADSVLHAAAKTGANVYYISYDKDMTAGFIQDCAQWARAFQAAASQIEETIFEEGDRAITSFRIKFDSGHAIITFSSNPRQLRGKGRPGERLVVDEAAFCDDLAAILKSAMAMTMWGGCIRIISTHNGVDNPFNTLVNDIRSGRFDYGLHRVTLDDALEDGLYRRICQVTDQPWSPAAQHDWRQALIKRYEPNADEELFCIPAESGGAWLSRALIESRMSAATPVFRYTARKGFELLPDHIREAEMAEWLDTHLGPVLATLPPEALAFVGEDFGRTGDLTVLIPLLQEQTLRRRCPCVLEMRNTPFRQQEQAIVYVLDRLRLMGGAFDARGNGQYLAERAMQHYGSRIQQVMLSEAWYREHMPPVKAALEDGDLDELPKDADILADLRAVEVIKGVPRIPDGRQTGADQGQRHGDSAVALALAYFASRELNSGPVTVASRRRRASATLLEGYDA